MLRATINSGNIGLAVFAVLMAAVSVYYYFRLIQSMYFKKGDAKQPFEMTPAFKFTLVGVAAVSILLGIFPNLITYWLYF
jgi:NADH-quinone oxidoreductase subunit N